MIVPLKAFKILVRLLYCCKRCQNWGNIELCNQTVANLQLCQRN